MTKQQLKAEAYSEYNKALDHGVLVRPEQCSQCGVAGRISGHHMDYTKPLEVVWLCHKCHRGEHKGERKRVPTGKIPSWYHDIEEYPPYVVRLKLSEYLEVFNIKTSVLAIRWDINRQTIDNWANRGDHVLLNMKTKKVLSLITRKIVYENV